MKKTLWIFLGVVLLGLTLLFIYGRSRSGSIVIRDIAIPVEVVDSDWRRAQGLSGRADLREDSGMFFIFEIEGKHGFWMKDMRFPLDIAWFDSSGKIIHIENSLSPSTYPEVFYPQTDALYVLEVNSGFLKRSGITTGDMAQLRLD